MGWGAMVKTLKQEEIFERNVMQYFELTVIASVEPNQPWTNRKM